MNTVGTDRRYVDVAVFGLLLGSVLMLLVLSGAFGAELVDPDEPAHFISGLLVRDYLADGLGQSPLGYAKNYYSHYPKVAIGNWPPLFHALEGVWLLVLPVHPSSILILLAVVTALLAWLIYMLLRRSVGTPYALLGAGMLVLIRPVPAHAGAVMIEMVLVLMTSLAVWLFSRYLDQMGIRHAAMFGAACLAAVLTKGNALFLALLPPFAIVIGQRWSVLRKPGLWYAALLVALIAGPWMVYFLSRAQAGWRDVAPSLGFMWAAGSYYLEGVFRVLGAVGLGLAVIGLWERVFRPGAHRSADSSVWVSAAAIVPAVIVFHALVPAGIELRHLIPAYPALVMLVAAGANRVGVAFERRGVKSRLATALMVGIAGFFFLVQAVRLPTKAFEGYGAAAAAVLERARPNEPATSLIVSNAAGEGAYIVEVAIRDDNRPSHTVWRATTLLARATWAGRDYRLRAEDDEALIQLLEQASVRMILLDRSTSRFRHQRQIEQTIATYPDRFALVQEFPLRKGERFLEDGLALYEMLPGSEWTPGSAPEIRQVPGYDGIEVAAPK